MTRLTAWLTLAFWLLPGSGLAKDYAESVPAESGGRLRVNLKSGSIAVESHPLHTVRVDARAAGLGSGSLEFDLSSDGGDARLEGEMGSWFGSLLSDPSVRVRIRVPEEYSLDIRTGNGHVSIESMRGDVSARTSGGAIEVDGVEGDVDVRTSGGAIAVEEVRGRLRAQTSGGPISVYEVEGDVDVRTSGGSIRVHQIEGSVDARTSGGSISVRFTVEPEGSLETSGGSVEVEYPRGSGIDLDARTSGGEVEIQAGIAVRGKVARDSVKAELNGGGSNLRVRTSGGSIRIGER